MATQDTTNNQDFFSDLQRHSATQDARISNLETKFEMFMGEMRDFNLIEREIPHFYKWWDESLILVDNFANID